MLEFSEEAHGSKANSVLHRYISEHVIVLVRAGDGVAGQGIRYAEGLTCKPACCEDFPSDAVGVGFQKHLMYSILICVFKVMQIT